MQIIKDIAKEAIGVFDDIAGNADSKLRSTHSPVNALANINSFTDKSVNQIQKHYSDSRENYERLAREPAIARVMVADENGKHTIYYICKGTPDPSGNPSIKFASYYKNDIGRLAALPVGSDHTFKLPTGEIDVEVRQQIKLHPEKSSAGWDSRNSFLEGFAPKPLTIVSLRALLEEVIGDDYDVDALDRLLAEDKVEENILEGIRRSVLTKMGLRDQPILDQYQDEIFRLPINSRLFIQGPPGTGKTTTLIKRLGQKLDKAFLEDEEQRLIASIDSSGMPVHEQSWLMFTPTELLRQYIKEAFGHENIPVSDSRITTWDDYRRKLGRNDFGILRSGSGSGVFMIKDKDGNDILNSQTQTQQIEWFSDFNTWQISAFWNELADAAQTLCDSENETALLGKKLSAIIQMADSDSPQNTFVSLGEVAAEIREMLEQTKDATDKVIRRGLNLQVNRDPKFIDEMVDFISGLSDAADDLEDLDAEEEEESPNVKLGRAAAVAAYGNAVRTQARAAAKKRSVSKSSRNGKIIQWLGNRSLADDELLEIGKSLLNQSAARRFADPVKRYIHGSHKRYRVFRRLRQSEKRWYKSEGFMAIDLHPLELDVLLLAVLMNAGTLIKDNRIARNMEQPIYAPLQSIRQLYRNQVLVDEATDFSPIQLACMAALTYPSIRSFCACGDFNQRVTSWGSRSESELKWVMPDIVVKSIDVSYRQSRLLNEFAKLIVQLSGSKSASAALPEHLDNEGVPPVLAVSLYNEPNTIDWLKHRILEIEKSLKKLPSIAILVNGEERVGPVAKGLNDKLSEYNIRVVACRDGLSVGQENDIRVFDVQHIKGLEFEAVFFVDIDSLANDYPDLFDKYLYVGATRAATYLGLTCAGDNLPEKIWPLKTLFLENWE